MDRDYSKFEEKLGYKFNDISLLERAFLHTTYVFEHGGEHYDSNQRLEFVGDAVLDLVVGLKLYDMKPEEGEGYLSKIRSIVVCEKSFADAARKLGCGEYLLLGKGEAHSGGADKDSTLADCFESVIAAVFIDGGYEAASECILRILNDTIVKAANGELFSDYKSRLLELAQTKGAQHKIIFEITGERGPAHDREFDCSVYADDVLLAQATGKSKKDAEQKAAEKAVGIYHEFYD